MGLSTESAVPPMLKFLFGLFVSCQATSVRVGALVIAASRDIEAAIARNDASAFAAAARGVDRNTAGLSDASVVVRALRQLRHTPNQFDVIRALLALLRCRAFEEVELSADWPVVPDNLAKLRVLVESKYGPPV